MILSKRLHTLEAFCFNQNLGFRKAQTQAVNQHRPFASSSRYDNGSGVVDEKTPDGNRLGGVGIIKGKGGGGAGIGNVFDKMLPSFIPSPKPLFQHCSNPKTVSIIGAPMTFGQPYVGTDHGPSFLRKAGLRSKLIALGWLVDDGPDLNFSAKALASPDDMVHPHAKNSSMIGRGTQILSQIVEEKAMSGSFPLVLGGDHSIAIGTLSGILRARPNTGVLWIDAHADLNTPDISESGNMHGMPVGLAMKEMGADYTAIPGFEWLGKEGTPMLAPNSIVYVGLRDVDMKEREAIRELGICAFTMSHIDRYGIGKVMDMAMTHLLAHDPNRPIHLSYDIDAVDPAIAPATGTAVRGGLTFREAHYVAEIVAASGVLASAEIVEVNPTLSHDRGAHATVEFSLGLITSLLGKSII